MKLLTDPIRAALVANNQRRAEDHIPVVKFFVPWGRGTWIITEIEPDGDTMFGLCDLGEPELGYVSLAEMESIVGPGGLRIERDTIFATTKPLSAWVETARSFGRIVDVE